MVCQILDAALATLKDPLLTQAAQEIALKKETNNETSAREELASERLRDSDSQIDLAAASQVSDSLTARSMDEVSDGSSQSA